AAKPLEELFLFNARLLLPPVRRLCGEIAIAVVEEIGVCASVGQIKIRGIINERGIQAGLRKYAIKYVTGSISCAFYGETQSFVHLNVMRFPRLVPGKRIQAKQVDLPCRRA